VLAQLEATLARHVGPMAAVMVRRASRSLQPTWPRCRPRLAEQITNPVARDAFLGRATHGGALSGGGRTASASAGADRTRLGSMPPDTAADAKRRSNRPVACWQRTVGPIASVVLKRALVRTRQREALFALLAEAAPEAARARLLAELARL
jgi:hypothetical protein